MRYVWNTPGRVAHSGSRVSNRANHRRIALLLLALFALCAVPATAQQSTSTHRLTLQQAVEMAIDHSTGLRAAASGVDASEARLQQARTLRLPAVGIEGSYMRVKEQDPATIDLPTTPAGATSISLGEGFANSYGATISVRQPLFAGREIESRVVAATHALAAERHAKAWRRQGLILESRTLYWRLADSTYRVNTIEERLKQVEARLRNAEERQRSGLVTRREVLSVEMQVADVELQLLRAVHERELVHARLALLVGLSPDDGIELITTFGAEETLPVTSEHNVAWYVERAIDSRHDIAELRGRLAASESSIDAARAGLYPKIALAGEYTYARPNQNSFPIQDRFDSSWRVGVVGTIALGTMPGVHFETRARDAERAALTAHLQGVRERVSLAVRESYLSWQRSINELELAKVSEEQAIENLADTRSLVDNGLALSEQLLDAEAQLLQAQLDLASSRTRVLVAWDTLLRETGEGL